MCAWGLFFAHPVQYRTAMQGVAACSLLVAQVDDYFVTLPLCLSLGYIEMVIFFCKL